jgi:hypothetical protein
LIFIANWQQQTCNNTSSILECVSVNNHSGTLAINRASTKLLKTKARKQQHLIGRDVKTATFMKHSGQACDLDYILELNRTLLGTLHITKKRTRTKQSLISASIILEEVKN